MKKLVIVFCFVLIAVISHAQNNPFISQKGINLQLTNNHIALGIKAQSKTSIGIEVHAGLGAFNQDYIFDDYIIKLNIPYSLRKRERSNTYAGITTGLGFITDLGSTITAPFAGIMCGYEYYFGKERNNGFSIELGYLYGTKDYTKTYKSSWGSVEYIGNFSYYPITVGLAYSYYI